MSEITRPPNAPRGGARHRGTWCNGTGRGQDPPYPPGSPPPGPGPTGPGPTGPGPTGPGNPGPGRLLTTGGTP